MDFVNSFTDMPRQDNMPMLQESISNSSDSLFLPVAQSSTFYQQNNLEGAFSLTNYTISCK